MSDRVKKAHAYATMLPPDGRAFVDECADLLESYEEQNAALLKRQDELLTVLNAAKVECEKHNSSTDFLVTPVTNAEGWTARQILRVLNGES